MNINPSWSNLLWKIGVTLVAIVAGAWWVSQVTASLKHLLNRTLGTFGAGAVVMLIWAALSFRYNPLGVRGRGVFPLIWGITLILFILVTLVLIDPSFAK